MTETITGAPARNYVGGEWREPASGETYEKRSPWRPSQVTGVYPASNADDARAAIEAAQSAFPAWSRLPAAQRAGFFGKAANALEARAEQIAQDMTAEMGKPLREARLEALRVRNMLSVQAGDNVVRLLPPLIIGEAEIDLAASTLDSACVALKRDALAHA